VVHLLGCARRPVPRASCWPASFSVTLWGRTWRVVRLQCAGIGHAPPGHPAFTRRPALLGEHHGGLAFGIPTALEAGQREHGALPPFEVTHRVHCLRPAYPVLARKIKGPSSFLLGP